MLLLMVSRKQYGWEQTSRPRQLTSGCVAGGEDDLPEEVVEIEDSDQEEASVLEQCEQLSSRLREALQAHREDRCRCTMLLVCTNLDTVSASQLYNSCAQQHRLSQISATLSAWNHATQTPCVSGLYKHSANGVDRISCTFV